ncbi:SPOSA6832_03238 [Sporobolomyces salmonicolor]|uniref:SPOSA6832_03238-mRNA-1:cds n=1 Tax=Sporidiobolus salmonicolor TaxID=5005 RepID=A0A0D6ENX9_SPOSA|nr:SPOSA6832_03238 [Sporobolomyces salmonicolor]
MTQAPAVGGASTSRANPAPQQQQRHSGWDPYAVLPPSIKRKLDPRDNLAVQPYLQSLAIPADVAEERVAAKYLQLDPPLGKLSDWRKAELATKDKEREKKRAKRAKEGDCGLMGRRKRAARGHHAVAAVSYAAVLPVHHLWLGYMAELLGLPIAIPPLPPSATTAPSTPAPGSVTSTLLPTYPSRHEPVPADAQDLQINVVNLQTKLVKAEFVGCILSVKRAKNPSLVGLKGIVLHETQGTFKLVTPASQIKVVAKQGSVFTLAVPLRPSTSTSPPTARELQLDLFGGSFAHRSAERVGRKWKAGTSAGGVEL